MKPGSKDLFDRLVFKATSEVDHTHYERRLSESASHGLLHNANMLSQRIERITRLGYHVEVWREWNTPEEPDVMRSKLVLDAPFKQLLPWNGAKA